MLPGQNAQQAVASNTRHRLQKHRSKAPGNPAISEARQNQARQKAIAQLKVDPGTSDQQLA
jgi:hypothetical protein